MRIFLLSCLTFAHAASAQQNRQGTKTNQKDIRQFWLIPRDPVSCLPKDKQQVIYVDKDKVSLQDCTTGSRTLKFPGCFVLKAEVQLLQELNTNMFGNIQFQWTSLPQVNNLKCEKQEQNGCGGVGNNCYYCDICKGIVQLQEDKRIKKQDEFRCPTKPKIYRLERQFNISDWSGLDENHNGVIDFLEDDNLQKVRDYLKAINVVGFGTLSIQFQIATNATSAQLTAKHAEEMRIRADVAKKYQFNQRSPDSIRTEANSEVNYWHRNSYLPWLLKTNQVACVTFFFDICLNEPSPFNLQSSFQCV